VESGLLMSLAPLRQHGPESLGRRSGCDASEGHVEPNHQHRCSKENLVVLYSSGNIERFHRKGLRFKMTTLGAEQLGIV